MVNNPQEIPDSEKIMYKGYIIEASPDELPDSNEWSVNIYIEKDKGFGSKCRNFSAKDTYKTKEETIKNCLIFGRQIIDGKYKNLTVADI